VLIIDSMEKAITDAVTAAVKNAVRDAVPIAINRAVPAAVDTAIPASVSTTFADAVDKAAQEKVKEIEVVMRRKLARDTDRADLIARAGVVCFCHPYPLG
jgi:hypothetical protein